MGLFDIEEFPNGKTLVTDKQTGAKGLFDTRTGAPLKGAIKGHLSNILEQEASDLAQSSPHASAAKAIFAKIKTARDAGGMTRLTILKDSVSRMLKGGLPSAALGILSDQGESTPRNIEESITRSPEYIRRHGA